jgi:8-hydroxy-5-deazaflavin:NADPH oxidoreductase
MTTIGIIGSGHVGSNLAQAAITHGYDVVLSNSGGPETLAGLVKNLGPSVRPSESGRTDGERGQGRVRRIARRGEDTW